MLDERNHDQFGASGDEEPEVSYHRDSSQGYIQGGAPRWVD